MGSCLRKFVSSPVRTIASLVKGKKGALGQRQKKLASVLHKTP